MADLELTLACWDYDITRPLRDGRVKSEGVNLTYLNVFPAENFQRNLQFREFDVAEMGLKFYVSTLGLEIRLTSPYRSSRSGFSATRRFISIAAAAFARPET